MDGLVKGVWQDMVLYWAWRETPTGQPFHAPPTVKQRDYVQAGGMTICAGVWDNDVYTPLHSKEIERLNK